MPASIVFVVAATITIVIFIIKLNTKLDERVESRRQQADWERRYMAHRDK